MVIVNDKQARFTCTLTNQTTGEFMKTSIKLVMTIAIVLGSTSTAFANSENYPAYLESSLENICKAAKDNNLVKFKRAVRKSGLDFRTIENGLVCNHLSVLDFAIENRAKSTALYLAKKAYINKREVLAKLNKSNGKMTVGE